MRGLLVFRFALIAALSLGLPALAENNHQGAISFCALSGNPEAYAGKVVTVSGRLEGSRRTTMTASTHDNCEEPMLLDVVLPGPHDLDHSAPPPTSATLQDLESALRSGHVVDVVVSGRFEPVFAYRGGIKIRLPGSKKHRLPKYVDGWFWLAHVESITVLPPILHK